LSAGDLGNCRAPVRAARNCGWWWWLEPSPAPSFFN
jgi:hypothetical protein